jgi:hypothetical protein
VNKQHSQGMSRYSKNSADKTEETDDEVRFFDNNATMTHMLTLSMNYIMYENTSIQ